MCAPSKKSNLTSALIPNVWKWFEFLDVLRFSRGSAAGWLAQLLKPWRAPKSCSAGATASGETSPEAPLERREWCHQTSDWLIGRASGLVSSRLEVQARWQQRSTVRSQTEAPALESTVLEMNGNYPTYSIIGYSFGNNHSNRNSFNDIHCKQLLRVSKPDQKQSRIHLEDK